VGKFHTANLGETFARTKTRSGTSKERSETLKARSETSKARSETSKEKNTSKGLSPRRPKCIV